ncbi:MAG: Rho termination factor N-terminal domain-containing protein [Chitinophagaceae bacterium]|nr:Rho termination factor N-terminal domain-containing protein [Chitinophagaceae bacterium]
MYDILQLNDMLVPELLDIAEQLNIPNAKKLDKQGLVYKILDSQAIAGSKGAPAAEEKGKRKRIIKTSTGISSEEAIVENTGEEKEEEKADKKPVKKGEYNCP